MAKEFLRVSELNELIKDVIHAGFPQPLWVCGEIQGYNRNRSKNHIFFELIEKDEDTDKIIAKVGLVLFAGKKLQINDILKRSENAFAIRDDIEVKFACSIDFYSPHGAIRLVVESIDPTYTLGRLAQEKQKLIALLKKNGVLDKNKQLPLPPVPLNIGLITSDDSAAYNDFISEIKHSGFGFKVHLHNALMQGVKAEREICHAIDNLVNLKKCDVIIITRGGGSIADLSCFDSKNIAEKIADCPLPVLSGIGHEINMSITDMAAHTYAKTPTAIAQFFVERVEAYLEELDIKCEQMLEGVNAKIQDEQQKLKDYAFNLQSDTIAYLKSHDEKIIRMQEVIKHKPTALLKESRKDLKETQSILLKLLDGYILNHHNRLAQYRKLIDSYDPVNTMRRGFSITRNKDGKPIKSIQSIQLREEMITEVSDGLIVSNVEHVTKESLKREKENYA